MKIRLTSLVLVFLLFTAAALGLQTTILPASADPARAEARTVNASGFVGDFHGDWSPEATAAWNKAIAALDAHLQITVPVVVKISLEPLPPETLGRGGSSGSRFGFPGAPTPDLWYPNSLANQLAGQRLSEGADVEVTLNSTIQWDYSGDPQKAHKGDKPDFVTTITHEIIHGMGFLGTADGSGAEGKWGDEDGILDPENLFHNRAGNAFICVVAGSPAAKPQASARTTTATIADIWDHFVVDGDGHSILDTDLWANPSADLKGVLTSDNLFWSGAHGVAANKGAPLKLFAPKEWSNGSSFSHLDDSTYDGGTDAFLTSQGSNIPNIEIGPRVLGMLSDMGWAVH